MKRIERVAPPSDGWTSPDIPPKIIEDLVKSAEARLFEIQKKLRAEGIVNPACILAGITPNEGHCLAGSGYSFTVMIELHHDGSALNG